MVKGIRELSYEDRLLERHRLRGDFILAYNIFHDRSETFEDTTSSCATAVFVYSGGKQPSLWDFPSRGMNSQWKWLILFHLTLSRDSWTKHGFPCSIPFLDSRAPSIYTCHGLRRPTVPLYLTNRFDLIGLSWSELAGLKCVPNIFILTDLIWIEELIIVLWWRKSWQTICRQLHRNWSF